MVTGYRRAWWRIAPLTVLVTVLAGTLSAFIAGAGFPNPWFEQLRKPSFMPIFSTLPLIWAAIYILIGIAWAMVLSIPPTMERLWGLAVFYTVLAITFARPIVMFAMHDMGFAKAMTAAMLVLGVIAAGLFYQLRRPAAFLLLPYIGWVAFAAAFTASLERLNPGAGSSLTTLTEASVQKARERTDSNVLEEERIEGKDVGGRGDARAQRGTERGMDVRASERQDPHRSR